MRKMMILGCAIAVTASVTLPARGATLCAGESAAVVIDLTAGVRTAAQTEQIRYSSAWEEDAGAAAVAIVEVNGESLNLAPRA